MKANNFYKYFLTLVLSSAFCFMCPQQSFGAPAVESLTPPVTAPQEKSDNSQEKQAENPTKEPSNVDEKAPSSSTPEPSKDSENQVENNSDKEPDNLNSEKDALAPIKEELKKPQDITPLIEKPKYNILSPSDPSGYAPKSGIWISDTGNGRIVYIKDLSGQDFYTLGLAGYGPGRFLEPEQIWVDIEGKIYVADKGNNRVIRMDDLRGLGWTEMEGFSFPTGVAAHGKRIFVSDTGNNRILVYDSFGAKEPMATLDDPKIKKPGYLWLNMEGDLFVCCGDFPPGGCVVRIPFNLTTPPAEWSVYKGQGLSGTTFAPTQVTQNEDGMYMVDGVSQRAVRISDMRGRNSWELGSYGSNMMEFLDPKGISQDEEGRIFIADTGNDRIVRMDNIKGQGWATYETTEPQFGLRAPRSVYVWSPRPEKEEAEEEETEEFTDSNSDTKKSDDKKDDSSKE